MGEVMSNLHFANSDTQTWEDSARCLLSTLILDSDTDDQVLRPVNTPAFVTDCSTRRWTYKEILRALNQTPLKTAPGNDRIESEMVRQLTLSPTFIRILITLFNSCLLHGCFPRVWKHGILKTLLKASDKDPQNPRSYRPVCLLPLRGKVLERLMRLRLRRIIIHPVFSSRHQYGFRKERSVEDAISAVRAMVADAPETYVVAILFDITAAFDSLTWPSLLRELHLRRCPADLAQLILDYLLSRSVEVRGNYTQVCKSVTRGCPQGSILGPDFWNTVFDGLLRTLEMRGFHFVAYADDLIILASADCRRALEQQGQKICTVVSTWTQAHHLTLSTTKTEMVALKGNLHRRPPIIRLSGDAIRYACSVRYLGVHFSTGFHIGTHLQRIGDGCKRIFTIFGQAA